MDGDSKSHRYNKRQCGSIEGGIFKLMLEFYAHLVDNILNYWELNFPSLFCYKCYRDPVILIHSRMETL